jgi:hypothetical protein
MAACHLWNPAVILIGLPAALDPKDSPWNSTPFFQ